MQEVFRALTPKAMGLSVMYSLTIALVALIAWQVGHSIVHNASKYKKRVDVPVINLEGTDYGSAANEYIQNAQQLYRKGRKQYPGQPFQLWGPEGYMLVIPEAWVDEMKDMNVDILDNTALIKGVLGDYPWLRLDHEVIIHTMATKFNPKLGQFLDTIEEELRFVLDTELRVGNDWTPIAALPFLMKTVAIVSGRIFVGAPLNRDPVWIESGIDYVIDVFKAGERLRTLPYLAKMVGVKLGLIEAVNRVANRKKDAHSRIVPLLEARRKAQQTDPDWKAPNDMVQFIADAPHSATSSFEEQAEIQLVVALSSIQSTSQVTVNILFDLCNWPEYFAPLREEVEEVLRENDDKFTKKALAKMIKLDSFIRESQRLNPSQITTFDRQVSTRQGITLKNGFHLPHGTRFAVATAQLHRDPEVFENPDDFDGFRFAKYRSAKTEDSTRYQFVSTNSKDSMSFSHGKHACPGRFLASAEIKIIVATLLMEYDIKFAPSVTKRPETIFFGHNTRPDPTAEILFRKRESFL